MWANHSNIFLRLFDTISGTVRYKLLLLVLFPILLLMPIALITAITWGKNYTYDQLFIKVKTDLSVSHDIFERIQQGYLNQLTTLAESYTFRTALEVGNQQSYNQQVAQLQRSAGFSFLNVIAINASHTNILESQRNSAALLMALQGRPKVSIEIYSADELAKESVDLASNVHLPLIKTPRARPSDKTSENRGMVIRTLYPIKDASGQVIALLDGGVLLNGNFGFVDEIRDLVYAPGNLPEGSIGTVTVFLDDVRISTNVPLKVGERALGTRVSDEVRSHVLDKGEDWIDRAFVVNDWYISSYEPIVDVDGNRVGMLYAGFLETPFRSKMWNAFWVLLLTFLVLMLLSAWAAIRGAKSIFKPLETMSKVMQATQEDKPKRVGLVASEDEIGVLATELDAMLDLLEHRKQEIQHSADLLETKVVERTAELQKKNDDLRRTIELLRETRQQLVIAEKLAALGELTAGVAHEINNPTAVILGSLDVLVEELGEAAEPVQDEIDITIEQVYRIKDIINSLLQYARPDEYAGYMTQVDVNELVEDSLKLVRHLQKDNDFTIKLDLQTDATVEINAPECQQVIVNLIVNAIHALPKLDEGLIKIRTRNWNNKGVMLSVRDNGKGITKEHQAHIFNPFFSTKQVGEGTGLGLSVSYSLIRRYGGNITVESELGKGAEFCVWILTEPRMMDDEEAIAEQLLGIENEAKIIQ